MKRISVCLVLLLLTAGLCFLPAGAGATAPVASFTSNITSGTTAPLAVQFIDTSTHAPATWTWSFGDGSISSEESPVHTYASAGTYTVTLTVTNADGSHTTAKTGYITISKSSGTPGAAFISNITSGPQPLAVQFVDASVGSPTTWAWSFGDGGTSPVQNPVHTYTSTGTYTVTLTAVNAAGSSTVSKTGYITVATSSSAPAAAFSALKTSGSVPLTIQFLDSSTNSPTSWVWSFGDGSTSAAQNPQHTYAAAGTYTVTLTATSAGGSSTVTKEDYITVSMSEPIASFSANITSGIPPLAVRFTDTSANTPTSWYWSFGDGESSSEQNPEHVYSEQGSYTVVFTAKNAEGSNTTSIKKYINITKVFVPVPSFTADVTSGTIPLTVRFTDTTLHSPTSWEWNFGDGGTSSLQNPEHQYITTGSFEVTLTASNAAGSRTATMRNYITASSPVESAVTTIPEQKAPEETGVTMAPTAAPAATPAEASAGGPGWIFPLFILAVIAVICILAISIARRPRHGQPPRKNERDL